MNTERTIDLYWTDPQDGSVCPDWINAYDEMGGRIPVSGEKIETGAVFKIPNVPKNQSLLGYYPPPVYSVGPPKSKPDKKPTGKKTEEKPPEEKAEPARPTRKLTKYEVMDKLAQNGIKFRTNELPENLYNKLPDDIKANFQLDQS